MKSGWETKKLGEVCEVIGGGTPSKDKTKAAFYSGNIHWATVRDMKSDVIKDTECKITKEAVKNSSTNIIPKGNVVIATRVGLGKICLLAHDTAINQDLRGIVPKDARKISVPFLFWWLKSVAHLIEREGTGATVKGVKLPFIKSLEIPTPPLTEQQRIVAILDKAFEDIAIAKANAEKNLNNARELFESYLQGVFANPGDGWEEKTLTQISENLDSRRVPITKKVRSNGHYPYYGASGIVDYVGEYIFDENLLLVSEDGANLLARTYPIAFSISGKTWVNNHAHVLRFQQMATQKFIEYILNSTPLDDYVSGMAQPKLNQKMLNSIVISCPPLSEQQRIVSKLDALSAETKKLEDFYRQKLAALEELKKSILNQAFTGELPESIIDACINNTLSENSAKNVMPVQTGIQSLDSRQSLPSRRRGRNDNSFSTADGHAGINSATNVIPFPKTIPDISTTDLHAGILAIAYHLHESNPEHLKTFGHVKAEKIAHMVEAYAGIDLGRNPVKDAAGPNDFHHLKKVESRARKAGYFDVKKDHEAGYSFIKSGQFNNIIEKTKKALGNDYEAVRIIIDQMLVMNTQQSEIFATVYAAWNNLLIKNEVVSDEAIVFEARENWHENKLKISAEKFFKAITWMREKNIVPKGVGKLVKKRT